MPTGRFAPSPTARLHLGNLRTALLAWLFARETDGRFLLRIEDLDQQRVAAAPGIAATQLTDLGRLGLDWDGPVIRQSTRLELYRQAVSDLDTYECYCTRREIAQAFMSCTTQDLLSEAYADERRKRRLRSSSAFASFFAASGNRSLS